MWALWREWKSVVEVRCEFFKNKRSYLVLLVCSKVYDTLSLENNFLVNSFKIKRYVDINLKPFSAYKLFEVIFL